MTRDPGERWRPVAESAPSASPLSVTVLGCAGSRYDEVTREPCSSYLVASSDTAFLFDSGRGSFASFASVADGVVLDAILVSHAHRDHFDDVQRFVRSPSLWREGPTIIATKPTLAVVADLADTDSLRTIAVDGARSLTLRDALMRFSMTAHQVPTVAVELSLVGRRVVYVADTGPSWQPPAAFFGADLAFVECTLQLRGSSDSPFHLDARECAELARRVGARTVLLTHVPPGEDAGERCRLAEAVAPEIVWLAASTGLRLGV